MIKDYSNVPVVKTITNNTDTDIVFQLRDVLQAPALIKKGDSLAICVRTSEGLAILTKKVEDLGLSLSDSEGKLIKIASASEFTTALSEAKDNDVLALVEDVTLTENTVLDKKITLDTTTKKLDMSDKVLGIMNDVTITGLGVITSSNQSCTVQVENGKLVANHVTIDNTTAYGITGHGNAEIELNNATINGSDGCIAGNNTSTDMLKVEINDGVLNSTNGSSIYAPAPCDIVVNDGTLNGGISARMGKITINEGTINSISKNNDKIEEYYNFKGNPWLGDAIACMAGTYTPRSKEQNNDLVLNLKGGTINGKCKGCSAVTIYNLGAVKQNILVFISKDAALTVADETQPTYKVVPATEIVPESKSDYATYTKYQNAVTENIA